MNSEKFYQENSVDGGFLQSDHWRKFQESAGKKVLVFEQENFSLRAFKHSLSVVGDYFFVPRGPIFLKNISDEQLGEVMKKVISECENKKAGWLRIEPQSQSDLEGIENVLGGDFCIKKSKKNHEPAQTLILDLEKSEEKLLAEMKQKTRYNIRLAEKKGVQIEESENPEKDINIFYEISKKTAERDKISIHPFKYYQKMVTEINNEKIKLYLAKYDEKVIGAIVVSFFGGVATYLHGASSNIHRNVMANYVLQWEAIKYAKKLGCEKYDFGGLKIDESDKNLWKGITRFKISFAPKEKIVDFPGCWDIVINKRRYFTYRILQGVKDLFN